MTEILTESFCERCGTRYTFESSAPRTSRLARVRTLSKGVRNFVMSDESSFSEAMAEARSEEELAATAHQLDAFHQTFNFCLTCRQYTCGDCWNGPVGRCLTCAPLPGQEPVAPTLVALPDVAPILAPAMDGNGHGDEIGVEDWPEIDLPGDRLARVLEAGPEPVAPHAIDAPQVAEPDPAVGRSTPSVIGIAPGQSLDEALAAYESRLDDEEAAAAEALVDVAAPAPPAAPLAPGVVEPQHAAPEGVTPVADAASGVEAVDAPVPVVRVVAPVAAEPEPEPVAAEPVAAPPVAAEPEPELVAPLPVAALPVAAEPEPEPVAAEPPVVAEPVAAQPVAAEPVAAEPLVEPEPEPVAAEPEPEPVAAQRVAAEPSAPPVDHVWQPTWPTPTAPTGPVPATPPTPAPVQPAGPAPWLTVAPEDNPPPQWPTTRVFPVAAARRDAPTTLAGRPLLPPSDATALWAASAKEVLGATPATFGAAPAPLPGSGPVPQAQPCVSCGLPLSANARFCRRCGSRQG